MGSTLSRRRSSRRHYKSSGNVNNDYHRTEYSQLESSRTGSMLSESYSALTFKLLDGRPYIDEETSPYLLPADWEEADRTQMAHFTLKQEFGGNYIAPLSEIIEPGSKILDIGCGPGHWSFEMAQEFPNAEIYGIDILPMFPTEIKPLNCHFQQCNITEGLPFDDNEFDYIFIRYFSLALKVHQWTTVLNEVRRVMKPGGIIECVELDLVSHSMGPVSDQFFKKISESLLIHKEIDTRFALKLESAFQNAEFEIITCDRKCMPLGKWNGKVGEIWASNFKQKLHSVKPIIFPLIGMTGEEWDNTVDAILHEFENYQTSHDHYIVLATKCGKGSLIG